MTVFERTTRLGDEETEVEVCRKSGEMLDFFTDFPIPPTSMGKSAPRTMELDEAERYNETYSYGSTIYDAIWEIPGKANDYLGGSQHDGQQ